MPQIYALVPPQELWAKPFADWTPEDWANPQHLSILWIIQTGTVHFKGGIQSAEETSQNGKTFRDLIAEIALIVLTSRPWSVPCRQKAPMASRPWIGW